MKSIVNYHVVDHNNVGDLFSAPAKYFDFPGFNVEEADIHEIKEEESKGKHIIVGGGGLVFPNFLDSFIKLREVNKDQNTKLISWGIGQQFYGGNYKQEKIQEFDYSKYIESFDLIGIRDAQNPYTWVPCVSCMHPAFDKKRDIQHEFVVFSHKKFQLKVDGFPTVTNDSHNIEEILDFLGSGETILTSSYHGAYWGTLLGRKVLSFPFSSKFYTLKHLPGIYPIKQWNNTRFKLSILKKTIFELNYKNKFSCKTDNWQSYLKYVQAYPDCLEENRQRNKSFHSEILNILNN